MLYSYSKPVLGFSQSLLCCFYTPYDNRYGFLGLLLNLHWAKWRLLTEEPSWNHTLVTLSVGWNISVLSAAQVTAVCQHLPPRDHSFTSPWQPQSSMPMDDWFHHGWLISHVLTAFRKHWDGVPEALLSALEHFHSVCCKSPKVEISPHSCDLPITRPQWERTRLAPGSTAGAHFAQYPRSQ